LQSTQFEKYLLKPVLEEEDQILHFSGILAKEFLLQFREAHGELTRTGPGLVQGAFELSVDPRAGAFIYA
jgi:hypothetical protein